MSTNNFDPYDFSKTEIDGVPVYYKNLPWAPCIHIRVVFKTGAFNDPAGKEGISHFLEHMIFNGCPSLPDKKAIQKWNKLHALNTWNAWTGYNLTCYWLKCLPEELDATLTGMRDMIFNPYLRPEDIEHERKVITQESWNRFINEKYLAHVKETMDNLYHGHDHARFGSAVGWPETIAAISPKDIKLWHRNNYGKGNFYIVVAGAVEKNNLESLKNFLKDLPEVQKTENKKEVLGKPKQRRFIKTADEIGEIKEQVEISFVRVAERRPYSENEIGSLAIKLMHDILNERLRTDKGICYSVDIGISRGRNYSQASMDVKTDEKNIELVENEFRNTIKEIIDKKHGDRFNTIKKMYAEQVRSSELLSADIASSTLHEISNFDGHIITLSEQLSDIERVSYEDVINFTEWTFDPEYVYTEIILPSKK
jgi:zinc protease